MPAAQEKYINKPPPPTASLPENEKLRKENPALMVTTHPVLAQWHKDSIRHVVGEYGWHWCDLCSAGRGSRCAGAACVETAAGPEDNDELFRAAGLARGSSAVQRDAASGSLEEEIVLSVNVEAKVEDLIDDIVGGTQDIMYA